ncbi:Golgi complex component 7-domain-containing protein [Rhodotorula diobovata]|uniref:Conserved oligomeric Golgi complex subunit 7 n=1 Tax=Rhodotorula diobovata TaxID=5288 RepID=A0A5C5G6U5_9BASI|nr:Golgi complex component 7-domain-containing protein [Rhodotorula diobovata]
MGNAPPDTGPGLTPPRHESPSPLSPSATPSPTSSTLDLAALTSDNFVSESDWLNDVLSTSLPGGGAGPPLADVESALTRTLHSLDLSVTDTSSLVDRLISDISLSVPRLAFDLQLMRENALLLRFTLDGIRKRGGGFGAESEVGKVLERMKVLDLVKQRMEAARDVLREAESWSTLESEVTGLVGEGQFMKAAERLAEAARSMVVFQNTAEYEARRALMLSLQNTLEASLSSGLVKAISDRDVKACKQLWTIFSMVQREQEYRAYYFGSRRTSLVQGWTHAKLVDSVENPPALSSTAAVTAQHPPQKFSAQLAQFYSELQTLLAEERTYVPAIFPDPSHTLSSFIETTLEGLSPSVPQRLTAIADFYGPLVLPELIASFKATEEFAVQVERTFAKLEPSPSPAAPVSPGAQAPPSPRHGHSPSSGSMSMSNGAPATPAAKRRMSKRRSLSKRLSSRSISFATGSGSDFLSDHGGAGDEDEGSGVSSAQVRPWETALFEPFLDWQVEYPELERRYLSAELERALSNPGEWVSGLLGGSSAAGSEKGAKVLLDKAARVFALLEDAIGRNLALTHGYGAKGLVGVMNELLVSFFEQRKGDLMRASREKGSAAARRRAQATAAALAGTDDEQEMVLEGLEFSTDDWSTFQFGLKLLDTCRAMADRLSTFEARLKSRMTVLAHVVREARLDPAGYTPPGTTRGAILLLRQSTLNSAELAELLDPLEKPLSDPQSHPHTALSHPPPVPAPTPFLLAKARGAAIDFTRTTQLFLHETILAPLLSHLAEYATLPCWTTSEAQRPGGKGAFDLAIPTFSLSPTETISRVGEGLFNLPRLFEVYAQDDALAFSIETLPFVDVESLRALQAPAPPPPSVGAPPMLRQTSSGGHRASSSDAAAAGLGPLGSPALGRSGRAPSGSISLSGPPAALAAPAAPLAPLSAEIVIATWLSSLTLSVLSHLTAAVLPSIARLSKHGAAQLVSDLDYISNVARALDVESPEELEAWREGAALDDKQLRGEAEGADKVERRVLERVARIRGVRRVGV